MHGKASPLTERTSYIHTHISVALYMYYLLSVELVLGRKSVKSSDLSLYAGPSSIASSHFPDPPLSPPICPPIPIPIPYTSPTSSYSSSPHLGPGPISDESAPHSSQDRSSVVVASPQGRRRLPIITL